MERGSSVKICVLPLPADLGKLSILYEIGFPIELCMPIAFQDKASVYQGKELPAKAVRIGDGLKKGLSVQIIVLYLLVVWKNVDSR